MSPEQAQQWLGNSGSSFDQQLAIFLQRWYSDSDVMEFYSSGTTGVPKKILLSKDAMRASAKQTISYFGLEAGEKILLCLSPEFIGGAMMLVRAMEGGLHLYTHSPDRITDLFHQQQTFSFVSMVPLQLIKLIEENLAATQSIFRRILLGGTALTPHQLEKIKEFPLKQLWMGYGMTETCSHIAIRQLSEAADTYSLMPGVEVRVHETGCLEVRGAITQNKWLLTSDLVHVKNNRLQFIGRLDDLINTGGIKVSPFEWETHARGVWHQKGFDSFEFVLTCLPDDQFGSALTLAVDHPITYSLEQLNEGMPKYQKIKSICVVDSFPKNKSGKLDRKELKKIIHS